MIYILLKWLYQAWKWSGSSAFLKVTNKKNIVFGINDIYFQEKWISDIYNYSKGIIYRLLKKHFEFK